MSAFIRGSAGMNTAWLTSYTDLRLPFFNWGPVWSKARLSPWEDGGLWPNSRTLGSTGSMFGGGTECACWGAPPEDGGNNVMQKITGLTRDADGAVLGSAVVQLYLTSNDQFLRQLTSDPGGYFEATSEYAAQNHYLVAYLAGSPDMAGTTVNTLQPS